VVAVRAGTPAALEEALGRVDVWLGAEEGEGSIPTVRTLDEALARRPRPNIALISVPGLYAAREARQALERGLHVFLFSDNVSLEDERDLKELSRDRGLLLMGPDCGTSIIGGVGLGFANGVRRGPIGVIGASGTGIQEITCLIHGLGSGVSHAMGIGGRDLSDSIGGISLLSALSALEKDPETRVILVVSKPPGRETLARIGARFSMVSKPLVVCFLGVGKRGIDTTLGGETVSTLEEAAVQAVRLAGGNLSKGAPLDPADVETLAERETVQMRPEQRYVRGLFAGGTFCYQAQQILRDAGIPVHSNVPLSGNEPLSGSLPSVQHTLVDLGSDELTAGRPHPMMDSRLRRERIQQEAKDPEVGILLLDIVLGFNASADPAGELIEAIEAAKEWSRAAGGYLSVVASVCGTEQDPQGFARQWGTLRTAGVVVFQSSARAAAFCAAAVKKRGG
jgi:succinyl-CoA synthetase alpha subunit